MKSGMLLIALACCLSASAQYKQFMVGGTIASNRWYTPVKSKHPGSQANPTRFTSGGLLLQWNSRYVFSLAVNPSYETTTRTYLEESYLYDWNTGTSQPRLRERIYYADRIMLPLLVKATIGKRVFFTPFVGMNYSLLLPSSYRFETFYTKTEDDNLSNPQNQSKTEADLTDAEEWNVFLGGGLLIPMKEKWMIHVDARIPFTQLSFPKSYERNEFMSYNKPSITVSLAYQFNWKKESSYQFNTFHLRFASTSGEK